MARRPVGSVVQLAPYADGSPRWRLSYETADDLGRRRRINQNVRAVDQADAERQLRALLDAKIAPAKDTVADVAERWKEAKAYRWKPSTAAFYRTALKRIIPVFGAAKVQDITADDANRWYGRLRREGLSSRVILSVHETLRAIVEYAIDCGLRSDNPIRRARPGPLTRKERPELTDAVLLEILAAVKSEQTKRMLQIAAITGMRPAELCTMRWRAIDWDAGVIEIKESTSIGIDPHTGEWSRIVTTPKTGAGIRRVALDPATIAILRDQQQWVGSQKRLPSGLSWVWLGQDPNIAISPTSLSVAFRRAAVKAGHSEYVLYDLRRWAITRTLTAGHADQLLMRRVGHTTTAMTGRYFTRSVEDDRRISATLSGALLDAR